MPEISTLYSVREVPKLELRGYPAESGKLRDASWTQISVGIGKIAIHTKNSPFANMQTRCGILATLGMENKPIGDALDIAESTVKYYLSSAWHKVMPEEFSRMRLTRLFFAKRLYRVAEASEPLQLSPRQHEVVQAIFEGNTRNQTGKKLYLGRPTIDAHMRNIQDKTGWSGQEQIVLGAIASGELGSYADAAIQTKVLAELGVQPSGPEQE